MTSAIDIGKLCPGSKPCSLILYKLRKKNGLCIFRVTKKNDERGGGAAAAETMTLTALNIH